MSVCKNCQTPLIGTWTRVFCSQSCSASFNNKARGKKPDRPRKFFRASGPYSKVQFTPCGTCGIHTWKLYGRKSCSDDCFIEAKRRCQRGTKHEYNGIQMDSGWEVELAQYLDLHSIKWIRPSESLLWKDEEGKSHRYFPDFYLPVLQIFLDPKNQFAAQKQATKLAYLRNHYPNVYWGSVHDLIEVVKTQGQDPHPGSYTESGFSARPVSPTGQSLALGARDLETQPYPNIRS